MRTISKLIVASLASVMFVSSALADCGCQTGGIPASALLPSIKFGENVKIIVVEKTQMRIPKVKTVNTAKTTTVTKARTVNTSKVKAEPVKVSNTDANIKCLTGTTVGEWNVRWVREGRGSCNGQILVSDAAKVANLAARGATELRVAFYIPEKCASGWASVPTKVNGNTISYYPWRKTCKAGHFNPRVVK